MFMKSICFLKDSDEYLERAKWEIDARSRATREQLTGKVRLWIKLVQFGGWGGLGVKDTCTCNFG